MPIRVECDVCGAKYRVDDRRAGTEIPCKDCDADIWVPEPGRSRGSARRETQGRGGRDRGVSDRWEFADDEPAEAGGIWANPAMFVVCLVAGGLVLAGIIFGAMFAMKDDDPAEPDKIAQNEPEKTQPEQKPENRTGPARNVPQPNSNPVFPQPNQNRNENPAPFNRPRPVPEPINKPVNEPVNPVVENNPINNEADPPGLIEQAPLPADLAGTWDYKPDPLPEPIVFEDERKLRVPFPTGVNANEVLWPTTPSFFVALGKNTFDRDSREVYDIRNRKDIGKIFGFRGWGGIHVLSPDGKFFAISNGDSNGVYVWDVAKSKRKGTLPLPASRGAAALGFAGPNRLAAIADDKAPLQVWSLPSGNPERTINLPEAAVAKSLTFSHGGKYAAIHSRKKESPAIHLIDLETGQFAGAVSVPRKGDNDFWVPECHALMISPDGEEIAGLFEEFGQGKNFFVFNLEKDAQVVFEYKFEDEHNTWWLDANSTPIQWFPSKKRWLIFGNLLLDREVGKLVWRFSTDKNTAASRRVLNDQLMIGATLEKGKPTLTSFPVEEDKIAKVADTVGAGGQLVDAKLPPLTAIDRGAVKLLSLDSGAGGWSARPDPAPAGESPLKDSVSVTATGGRMTGLLLSNPASGRAVVFSEFQRSPRPIPGRTTATKGTIAHIDVYNLRTGRRADQLDFEFLTRMAAFSPSGNRIASVLEPDKDRIDLWSADEGKPVLALRPYNDEDKNYRRVEAVAFVDDEHLLTLNNQKKLVMWKLPECRAVYEIAEATDPGLSPNQQYLAVSTGHGYLLLDSRTGNHVGSFNIAGTMHAAAFHPDGSRFAASCTGPRGPSIVVWSMEDGSVLTEFPIQTTAKSMHWCAGDHLLMNNETLIDVEHELIVWKYRLPPGNGAHSAQSPDGRHWYITPKGASGAELIAATLPEPRVSEFLAQKKLEPEFLLQPGGQLSVQINIPDSGPGQEKLRQRTLQNLVAKYQDTGTSVGGGSDLVIAMDLNENDTGKSQELVLQQTRSPFGAPIFNRLGGGEEISVPLKNIECKVTFTYQGKLLHEQKATYSNSVSGFFSERIKEGLSPEQHLEQKMWGMAGSFFTNYSPPVYVFRDFEGKGFGLSTLTDRGSLPQGVGG